MRSKIRVRRRWQYRLGAIAFGLSLLALVEATLVIFHVGDIDNSRDPFVGFRGSRPLFVRDTENGVYRISETRLDFFCEDSFDIRKGSNEFRIFCLGGSTVQGRPFAIQTAFTTWLQLALETADPSRRWKVVNCGGVSYASYRLIPILREVLTHAPDLIVVYTGHNEFLEDRTYDHLKNRPPWLRRTYSVVNQLRIFRLSDRWLRSLIAPGDSPAPSRRPQLPEEVEAVLDYKDGLASYHFDRQWRVDVMAHYRSNLGRIVQLSRQADVPLVLLNPVSNIRDCPPFKSEHREGLSTAELNRWQELFDQAESESMSNPFVAIRLLKESLAIDSQYADAYFLLAQNYEKIGKHDQARHAYVQAKDFDVCPLRILEPMTRSLLEIAERTGTPIVDVKQRIEAKSPHNLPDKTWMIDHVHPTVEGHQLIATSIVDELVRRSIVHPADGWEGNLGPVFAKHSASLGEYYHVKGMDTLRSVRRWARGQATRTKPNSNP